MGAALHLGPGADSGVRGALGNTKAAIHQIPSESRLDSGDREAKRKKCQWRLLEGQGWFVYKGQFTGLDMVNFYELFPLKNTLEGRVAPWESQTGKRQGQK